MRRLSLAAVLALLIVPASAHAAWFPAETIDGPNADVIGLGDVDISRDGTGGVVYLKRLGGVPHVFLSRFQDGVFQPPELVDTGMAGASAQPVIGVADAGRTAIAFVNNDTLFTTVRPRGEAAFSPPTPLAQGAISNPSIDVSINGATYVSWTQAGDVRVARAERDSPTFTILPVPVDVDPAQPAGVGPDSRSQVAVSADGTALVTWGERGADGRVHVYARRLFELRVSTAPQDLTLDALDGQHAGSADRPVVDIEDDSSYAWVAFRQTTATGPRVVMRRLVGSLFDPPVAVDAGRFGDRVSLDLTGRGEAMFGVRGANGEVVGGSVFMDGVNMNQVFAAPSPVAPVAATISENEDGAVAWMQGTGGGQVAVVGRYVNDVERPQADPDALLSRPEWGPVDPEAGIDAGASRAGDIVVVFLQNGPDGRRLVAGIFDKPPGYVNGFNTTKRRKLTRFAWGDSLNLLGPVTYQVFVDGQPIGQTTNTRLPVAPGQVPDGTHRWYVQFSDRRGQLNRSHTRYVRVDNTPPVLRVSIDRDGRRVAVRVRAADSEGVKPSGMSRVLVDFGDGRLVRLRGRTVSKTYAGRGARTIRVKALDRAGNETVVERRVRIG